MGGLKNQWISKEEQSHDQLAVHLGISAQELALLDYEIDAEMSDDDLVYCYRIEFSEECPLYVLEKIPGLEDGRLVRLSASVIEIDEDAHDYDRRFDAVRDNSSPFKYFCSEINSVHQLIDISIDPSIQPILFRQIFINVIGLLETYLSDTFINTTLEHEVYLQKFIRTPPEFGKRKFELREIYQHFSELKYTAKTVMLDVIYHKLPTVRQMYSATFGITFPKINAMMEYVQNRHDLVHRNGKRKDGSMLVIDQLLLRMMINDTTEFIKHIEREMDATIPF